LIWVLGAFASGCGSGPALRYEEFYTSDGAEQRLGSGCMVPDDGVTGSSLSGVAGGGGQAMQQPYSIEYEGKNGGFIVTVRDGTQTVRARREYDEAFLDEGRSDELVVDLESDTLRLRYFGAPSCDP
jgi:hypothetical protein